MLQATDFHPILNVNKVYISERNLEKAESLDLKMSKDGESITSFGNLFNK